MRDRDALANNVAKWREKLFSLPPEARLTMFEAAAGEVAKFIGRGFDRVEIGDRLNDLAVQVGSGLDDVDARQRIIVAAILRAANGHDAPLPYVELAAELKQREWLAHNRIPMRNVTLVTGEGAIGKSLLAMLLSGAVILGKEWIGIRPTRGPALYVSCEEEDNEIRLRMEDVARHLGSSRKEMVERGLRVLSFAGENAILAQPDHRSGIMRPTELFKRIRHDALELRPKLIVIDTAADTFGGKEIDRAQTRQFITILRKLAMDCNSAVVLIAHPSLTGINTDSGLSGSTGWHNGPRARAYFKPLKDDPALRVLEFRKNNYGPITETVVLRWKDGVFVAEPGEGTFEQRMREVEIGILFIDLLRRFNAQGRNVSDKRSPSYAPAVFAAEPEAKAAKVTKEALVEAMTRLFAAGKIRVVTEGPPSRQRSRIVEPSNAPSNEVPTPSNGGAHTHPL